MRGAVVVGAGLTPAETRRGASDTRTSVRPGTSARPAGFCHIFVVSSVNPIMHIVSYRHRRSHRFVTAAAVVALLGLTAAAQRTDVNGASPSSKLTTVLAELSGSV